MKALALAILFFFAVSINQPLHAQCSVCTRTAQQLGEKPARGLNSGILYLAFAPFAIGALIGYNWWKRNRDPE